MKATADRIKARADQLRTLGFKLRAGMVRATLELNSGATAPFSQSNEERNLPVEESPKITPEAA
ncbi:MAG TPA: hypothetical protein VE133_11525 [Candidatus Sulfotelmatobacter sp.]|nr:hypothetical protein [Candidatus Sulfotelmatobacter sp.]